MKLTHEISISQKIQPWKNSKTSNFQIFINRNIKIKFRIFANSHYGETGPPQDTLIAQKLKQQKLKHPSFWTKT